MGNPLLWTAATVVTSIRNTIGDPSTGTNTPRWSASEIDGYYNRAAIQVVLDTEVPLKTTWTFSLVSGQREYSMAPNFYKASLLQWVKSSTDRRRLQHIAFEVYRDLHVQDETRTGEPLAYYQWSKMGTDPTTYLPPLVFIHPTPGAAEDATTIQVYGYKFPDAINSTSAGTAVVELPIPHVEAAVLYASFLILSDDGDPGASVKFQLYERNTQKIMESMAREDLSGPARIRPKGHRGPDWTAQGPIYPGWW
jgi:hypothetical protein